MLNLLAGTETYACLSKALGSVATAVSIEVLGAAMCCGQCDQGVFWGDAHGGPQPSHHEDLMSPYRRTVVCLILLIVAITASFFYYVAFSQWTVFGEEYSFLYIFAAIVGTMALLIGLILVWDGMRAPNYTNLHPVVAGERHTNMPKSRPEDAEDVAAKLLRRSRLGYV